MAGEIVILITASSEKEAQAIAESLVEERLAACVNLVRGVESIFRWQGKISREQEVLMVVKTRGDLFVPLSARVRALHSYSVPEVIALPILEGSEDYLSWLRESTRLID